jgi:hypothetical protein
VRGGSANHGGDHNIEVYSSATPSHPHLFGKLKCNNRGAIFQAGDSLVASVQKWLESADPEFYRADIHVLAPRWRETVEVDGDYIGEQDFVPKHSMCPLYEYQSCKVKTELKNIVHYFWSYPRLVIFYESSQLKYAPFVRLSLSLGMKRLENSCLDFHQILYFTVLLQFVDTFKFLLNS